MRHLFGTDGIRGVAGEYPLDRRTTRLIGRALGHFLSSKTRNPSVVIGEDTRESSSAIAAFVAAGLESAGVRVESAGVITTPGVAFLARTGDFAAGIVISASHNPWQDNGIKVFGHDGYKLPDDVELEIEKEIFSQLAADSADEPLASKPLRDSTELHRHYVKWLQSSVDAAKLSRLRVVVDSANGAASAIAPEVFRACGVQATFISNQPDGRNINQQCGALHPEVVGRAVRELHADLGITLDGDADRALFSDAPGNVINGDAVMLLAAREMKARGSLANDTVVATTMSNMG
jgi:phosphoglucosamine mutase